MQLRIMSREEAEDTIPNPRWAVVSITDPGSRPADIRPGWCAVLGLQFHDFDLDKHISPHLRAEILKNYPPMTEEQARIVVRFVGQMRAVPVDGIVCHCEAGISRSAAVAKWIADHYRLPPMGPAVMAHNHYVYRLLCEAAERSRP